MTETEGVQRKNKALISELTHKEAKKLIKSEIIRDGMLPKVTCCLDALKSGVNKTHIIDGRLPHTILLEIFTSTGIGTEIILR